MLFLLIFILDTHIILIHYYTYLILLNVKFLRLGYGVLKCHEIYFFEIFNFNENKNQILI